MDHVMTLLVPAKVLYVTCGHMIYIHDVIHWITATSYDKHNYLSEILLLGSKAKTGVLVHQSVCVEVLRPSQPNGVMSSEVSHVFLCDRSYLVWSNCTWNKIFRSVHTSGPSCSKLTMSFVNILLKCWSLNMAYTLIFLLKNMSSFCICYSHFFSKNTCEIHVVIVLTRTINILTTNELVKLTMLWTTGPRA